MNGHPGAAEIERAFREQHGRAVAVLVRLLGDIDRAEEAVQDAWAVAVEQWPRGGLPPSPAGWIITTARNRAIDRHRRESTRDARHAEAARRLDQSADLRLDEGPLRDDELRLIFSCCHPALSTQAQVALTLRLVGGLTTPQIARAFLRRRRRWRSASSAPRRRSARRRSRTACPAPPSCRTGCAPCSPSST